MYEHTSPEVGILHRTDPLGTIPFDLHPGFSDLRVVSKHYHQRSKAGLQRMCIQSTTLRWAYSSPHICDSLWESAPCWDCLARSAFLAKFARMVTSRSEDVASLRSCFEDCWRFQLHCYGGCVGASSGQRASSGRCHFGIASASRRWVGYLWCSCFYLSLELGVLFHLARHDWFSTSWLIPRNKPISLHSRFRKNQNSSPISITKLQRLASSFLHYLPNSHQYFQKTPALSPFAALLDFR